MLVEINVGGTIFHTHKSTLTRHPESFLAVAVNSERTERDSQGKVFIDRNPKLFSRLLDLLRADIPAENIKAPINQELADEAEYYGLPWNSPTISALDTAEGEIIFPFDQKSRFENFLEKYPQHLQSYGPNGHLFVDIPKRYMEAWINCYYTRSIDILDLYFWYHTSIHRSNVLDLCFVPTILIKSAPFLVTSQSEIDQSLGPNLERIIDDVNTQSPEHWRELAKSWADVSNTRNWSQRTTFNDFLLAKIPRNH